MPVNRDDLLHLLRDARLSGQSVERLLLPLVQRYPGHSEGRDAIEAFLEQTRKQRDLLAECVRRIEDAESVVQSAEPDSATMRRMRSGAGSGTFHELLRARLFVLREVDLYASIIDTAESGGFFETRFVCEGIRSQKSSLAEWLSTRASSECNWSDAVFDRSATNGVPADRVLA